MEAIRAFVNGKTRFTYTMTVDARLQKTFTVGGLRMTGVLDVYNVFNTRTEIEEYRGDRAAVPHDLRRAAAALDAPRHQAGVLSRARQPTRIRARRAQRSPTR